MVPAVYLASVLVMPIQSVTKEQDIKRTTFPNYMHKHPPMAEYWPGNRSVGTGSHRKKYPVPAPNPEALSGLRNMGLRL